MDIQSSDQLAGKKCVPCEGGVDPCPLPHITEQLESLPGWYLTNENQRIRKDWRMENFVHDLSIEIWTHAIGGLSENDFILAAKIDQIAIPDAK